MSEFFTDEEKVFLPPDYSGRDSELPFDSDLDDGEETDYDDDELDDDDEVTRLEELKKESKEMEGFNAPFSVQQSKPKIESSPTWGWSSNNGGGTMNTGWSNPSNGSTTPWWERNSGNQNAPKAGEMQQINRNKRIVYIDFLDGLMETYQSNGIPGRIPMAVYDLVPKFRVWEKIAAFSPELVVALVQKNILNDINGIDGWSRVLDGWCCCLSSFLKKPYGCVQILMSKDLYKPKHEIIRESMRGFNKSECIYIGLRSGFANQPNDDIIAAQKCGIDYLDLGQLLTETY